MKRIRSLLDEIAHNEWEGRSLMQEGRLSDDVFRCDPIWLDYPWAKQLSFVIADVTYTLRIPRKTCLEGMWQPVESATLEPQPRSDHEEKAIGILTLILDGTQALP